MRRSWYEKYEKLVKFWKQYGNFVLNLNDDRILYEWVHTQRARFHGNGTKYSSLSKLEVYLLERIEFTWSSERYEIEWQQTYDEVVKFLEAEGHFPTRLENLRLACWTYVQRQKYKGRNANTLSEQQIQQLE